MATDGDEGLEFANIVDKINALLGAIGRLEERFPDNLNSEVLQEFKGQLTSARKHYWTIAFMLAVTGNNRKPDHSTE